MKRIGITATERQEHLALMEWIGYHPYLSDHLIHIANEYDGGAVKGKLRQRMGVKKGVSDFFLAIPTPFYHGLWIELKSKNGKPTPTQLEWLARMKLVGFETKVCYGCNDAISTIEHYLTNSSLVKNV